MAMTLDQLREEVRGEVVVPGDETYGEARRRGPLTAAGRGGR